MNELTVLPSKDTTEEVAALIEILNESVQRLEELTDGEVDAVADREGRSFLLRHAQDHLRHAEAAKQTAILNALPAHIALLDTQGIIISVNEAWRGFISGNAIQRPGYKIGLNYIDICDGSLGENSSEAHKIAEGIRSVLAGTAGSFSIEYPSHSSEPQRWFLLTVTPMAHKSRNGAVVMHLDISEQKRDAIARRQTEAALYVERERAQVTLNSIADAVACTNITGNITYLNSAAERMTGWSLEEAAGRPMATVLRILHAKSRETIADPMEKAVAGDRTLHLPPNCILLGRDGSETPIEDSIAPIHDSEGEVSGAVIVFRDVRAARTMAAQMAHVAEHDFLTGLPNRMLLNDRINQAISMAARNKKKLAVLFLDLDGFKHINDSLGHPVGDKLLQSVAERLVDCVRASDTVSRQGGDEFVVLVSETADEDGVAVLANRILQAVSEAHLADHHDLHITTSIGVSVYPEDGLDAEALIKNADTAMYQAKGNGRHSYQFFKPAMTVQAVERQSIEESLRRALARKEFELYYQPKINLKTGAITGAEALIRWTTPTRGSISPAQFIPIAEDCGLIVPLGAWVLREACKQARSWLDAGLPPMTMAVNVSAAEFKDKNYLDNLCATLNATGLDPALLELELTESVLMKHVESTASILKALRERGVKVAIDDFGTGYSSLSYLRKFPVDALKIDQAFIREIHTTGDDTVIVTAILAMAQSLHLRVVAEGVETREELEFLQAHGCDEAQGYYFSRPVSSKQFAKLLRTGVRGMTCIRAVA